jgi:hypothetical protein
MHKQKRLFSLTLLLCLVALVVSLVFNALLFLQARHYYLQLNKTNLDPLGLSVFSADSLPQDVPAASTATVVFFGDSRAEMWPAPAKLKGFSFVNRGINTQTSAQVLGRFDKHVVPLHPNIVIVQVGINDLKTIPLFPERKAAIITNCKANIQQIVARSVNSGATVILTTIFPIGPVPLTRQPVLVSRYSPSRIGSKRLLILTKSNQCLDFGCLLTPSTEWSSAKQLRS